MAVANGCRLGAGWTPSQLHGRGPDGAPSGPAIDLLRLLADDAGCTLDLIEMEPPALADALRAGRLDVTVGLAPEDDVRAIVLAHLPAALTGERGGWLLLSGRSLAPPLAARISAAAERVLADGRAELVVQRYRALAAGGA